MNNNSIRPPLPLDCIGSTVNNYYAPPTFLVGALVGGYGIAVSEVIIALVRYTRNLVFKAYPPRIFSLSRPTPLLYFNGSLPYAFGFSVNAVMSENYGKITGVLASATSNAMFFMAKEQHQSANLRHPLVLKTALGKFFPLFFYQAFFMSSILYLGPQLGDHMKTDLVKSEDGSTHKKNEILWNSVGRLMLGSLGALLPNYFFNSNSHSHYSKKRTLILSGENIHEGFSKSVPNVNFAMRGFFAKAGLASAGMISLGIAFDLLNRPQSEKVEAGKEWKITP